MRIYGLIGKNLSHSSSARYFNQKFLKEEITNTRYKNFELKNILEFPKLIKENDISGLNITKPFKESIITKGTVKDLIQTARNRYQANLPGLAVKLGACTRHYQSNSEELKKFTSFKNFLYKTVKISEPN